MLRAVVVNVDTLRFRDFNDCRQDFFEVLLLSQRFDRLNQNANIVRAALANDASVPLA